MPRLRCARCERPASHCLCVVLPKLHSRTQVLILQDPREAGHALNTARLAWLGLASAVRVVADDFDPGLWVRPGVQAYLLFPGDGAQEAGPAVPEPRLLVVPDATWRGARAMLARHPSLAALPRLSFPAPAQGRYRVRHADLPGAVSTVEAIAAALNALESTQRFDALLAPLERMVQGQIEGMGRTRYEAHHVKRQGSRSGE
ncbi:tRNA-uridine aminocarboxypropyltransferase [Bordetella avium]|uniref:tRNA-uridine aminocarboxypropyltransferase n=1 Tax=Bordetella avium (strain 197N) TaxID=360910 RepID=Q2KZA9_BORA1|nr:DTW domain-containing protein [Bordetella avium]AZY52791.1 DTW domain-containing protein [Bordetella avium]RIQ12132.1 DTW domain-containing protein [Bordetella avium]RIQ19048.1 DTW domain-containing protein [Bordetella avium]RIQ31957.1 DTW domain-containing protein [Bordetella avium]RIQ38090.1 DTW domain-containing protein [Bordetella avium]